MYHVVSSELDSTELFKISISKRKKKHIRDAIELKDWA